MKRIDAALYWLEQGVAAIPCKFNTKIPNQKWRNWQDKLPSAEQLHKWFFNSSSNLALVTGGLTSLTVLDFDNPELYQSWCKTLPKMAETYTVETPRPGIHAYFRVLNRTVKQVKIAGLDVKARGGIVIAPPSMVKYKLYTVRHESEVFTVNSLDELLLPEWHKETIERSMPRSNNGSAVIGNTSSIAQIKEQLSIYELVSQYTELLPSCQQGRWFIGICPVHADKNPSLRVDTVGQKCYCFSSHCALHNQGGNDVVDFYSKLHQIPLAQAVAELALQYCC